MWRRKEANTQVHGSGLANGDATPCLDIYIAEISKHWAWPHALTQASFKLIGIAAHKKAYQ